MVSPEKKKSRATTCIHSRMESHNKCRQAYIYTKGFGKTDLHKSSHG